MLKQAIQQAKTTANSLSRIRSTKDLIKRGIERDMNSRQVYENIVRQRFEREATILPWINSVKWTARKARLGYSTKVGQMTGAMRAAAINQVRNTYRFSQKPNWTPPSQLPYFIKMNQKYNYMAPPSFQEEITIAQEEQLSADKIIREVLGNF